MNKIYSLILAIVVFFFFAGCDNALNAKKGDAIKDKQGLTEVSFYLDLNEDQGMMATLEKSSLIDDGLTIAERKELLAYRKSRIDSIRFQFQVKGEDPFPYHHYYTFPVEDGIVQGTMEVDREDFYLTVSSIGNEGNIYFYDFDQVTELDTRDQEELTLTVNLQTRRFVQGGLKIWAVDKQLTPGEEVAIQFINSQETQVIWMSSAFTATDNGPIYSPWIGMNAVKTDLFKLKIDGQEFEADSFNIMDIVDDHIVEIVARPVPKTQLDVEIGFADQKEFSIESTFPVNGDSLVHMDIDNITASFSQDYAGLDEMSGARIVVKDNSGNIINGTTSWTGSAVSKNISTPSGEKIYLQPNTGYTACVENIISKYGKELSGQNCWSFTTEPGPLFLSYDIGNEENYDKSLVGGTSAILSAFKVEALEDGFFIMDLSFFGQNLLHMFQRLELVDSDKETIIAQGNIVSSDTVKFPNFDYRMARSATFYLKGTLNKIGKDFVGINNAQTSFTGVSIYAQNPSKEKNFYSRRTTAPSNMITAVEE